VKERGAETARLDCWAFPLKVYHWKEKPMRIATQSMPKFWRRDYRDTWWKTRGAQEQRITFEQRQCFCQKDPKKPLIESLV